MSYQNGGRRVVMGAEETDGLLKVKPMSYLEERRRRNLCVSFSLLALFLTMCGSLMVWRLGHFRAQQGMNENLPDYDTRGPAPSAGLEYLNKHLNHQSKLMKKGCESTFLLMRHCEKTGPSEIDDDGNSHCSYIGQERSYFLTTLFGNRWPIPSKLFALTPSRSDHANFREYETLHPLSVKIGVPIEEATQKDLVHTYFKLLQSGEMCGKLTVASWKHSYIVEMAKMLGCEEIDGCPPEFPETSFDQVWQLKYVYYPFAADDLEEEQDYLHNNTHRRDLRSREILESSAGWRVFGTVSQQGFDPLAFSYKAGDYPVGGAPVAGKWKEEL